MQRVLSRFGGVLLSVLLTSAGGHGEGATATPPTQAWVSQATATQEAETLPIDLPSVLKLAEDQNLRIAQDRAGVRVQRGLYRESLTQILPDIQGSVGQSRLEGGTQVFGGEVFNVVRTTAQPQVGVVWTVNPAGQQVYQALAARRRQGAAQAQVLLSTQQQLAQAAREFYQLLAVEAQKRVVMQAVDQAQAQVNAADARYRSGVGTKFDWLRAQAQLAEQQRQLTEAESGRIRAAQALLNRLNLEPTLRLVALPPTTDILSDPTVMASRALVAIDEQKPETLFRQAQQQNPTLARVEAELKALGWDRKSLWAEMVPTVTLRANISGTGPDWQNLTRSDFRAFSVNANLLTGLGLNLPAQLSTNRARLEQKLLERQALVRDIETQVQTALLDSRNQQSALTAAERAVAAAEEGERLASTRYAAGYGTNLEVVDAQTTLANARAQRIQAILRYNQAQVSLLEALGRVSPQTLVQGLPPDADPS